MREKVLVIPKWKFLQISSSTGFIPNNEHVIERVLFQSYFVPRDAVEEDERFLQVVTYCLITWNDKSGKDLWFNYKRGNSLGEPRLNALRSIGVGGHINDIDFDGISNEEGVKRSITRELREEIVIDTSFAYSPLHGIIYDPSNDVGSRHIGIFSCVNLVHNRIDSFEIGIEDCKMSNQEDIKNSIDEYESWSKLIINKFTDTNMGKYIYGKF